MVSKNTLSKCVGFVQYGNQFSFITKLKFWRRKLHYINFFSSDWLFCDCDWPDGPTTFLEFGKTLTWITWRGQVNVKSLVFLSGQANKNLIFHFFWNYFDDMDGKLQLRYYSCMHELCVGTLVFIYNNFDSCREVWLSNYHFQVGVLQITFLHTSFTGFIQFKYIPKLRHKFSGFSGIDSFNKYLHVVWLLIFQRKKSKYT